MLAHKTPVNSASYEVSTLQCQDVWDLGLRPLGAGQWTSDVYSVLGNEKAFAKAPYTH